MPIRSLSSTARRAAAIGVFSVLSACTGHPTGALPPNPFQALPGLRLPADVSDQALPARWWALYHDPQLNAWVLQALAHNQDLAQAEANVQAMLAGIGEFDARRWPSTSIGMGASYGKSADDQTLAEATDSHAPSQWAFNPSIELAYQVDVWGQVRAAIERPRVPQGGLLVGLALLWAGASWAAEPAELARGKELFTKIQPACAVCHTLQAAGAEGQVGPVLDELKPDAGRVLRALKAGIGVMPSYAERMSEKDMLAVAQFVAHATGAAK